MKKVIGWWFGTTDRKLLNKDGRKIVIGKTHKVRGEIIPCKHGLHLSEKVIDALEYAPGPVVYRVVGSGIIIPDDLLDKYVCSERKYIAGGIDVSETLRLFARNCALDVIHLWNPPDIVVKYLKTGDESIRAAAQVVARDGAWAAAQAGAQTAAWSAVWAADQAMAQVVARAGSWDAVRAEAQTAVKAAAWAVTWDVAKNKQNRRLTAMISKLL